MICGSDFKVETRHLHCLPQRANSVCWIFRLSLSLSLTNTPKWTHFTCQTSTLNAVVIEPHCHAVGFYHHVRSLLSQTLILPRASVFFYKQRDDGNEVTPDQRDGEDEVVSLVQTYRKLIFFNYLQPYPNLISNLCVH